MLEVLNAQIIEPEWNVKAFRGMNKDESLEQIIEPEWNVKIKNVTKIVSSDLAQIIEPEWNVKE